MDKLIFVGDIVEKNGKTIRENNQAIQHYIKVGTLVEVLPHEDSEYNGVRLFVVSHGRDCDGTPLYSLGVGDKVYDWGFAEENLRIVDAEK